MGTGSHYIFSVDVEDYFQVEAFTPPGVARRLGPLAVAGCGQHSPRTGPMRRPGAKAIFCPGLGRPKFPALVREIQARGHELACHSFWHRPVCSLTPESFREDLRESCDAIAQASGVRVIGFRAPSWSITPESLWAFDILAEEGFVYDASIFPIRHDLYGYPGGQRFPHKSKPRAGS